MYKATSSFHPASKSSFSVARTCPTRAELAFHASACLFGIWRVAGKLDFLTCFSTRCIPWVTCLLTPCLKIHFNHDSKRMLCTDLCISSIQARGTRNAIVSDFTLRHFPHLHAFFVGVTVLTWWVAPPKMFCNCYRI